MVIADRERRQIRQLLDLRRQARELVVLHPQPVVSLLRQDPHAEMKHGEHA